MAAHYRLGGLRIPTRMLPPTLDTKSDRDNSMWDGMGWELSYAVPRYAVAS